MRSPSLDEIPGDSGSAVSSSSGSFLLTVRDLLGKNMRNERTEADKKFVHHQTVISEEMNDGYFEQVNLFKYL